MGLISAFVFAHAYNLAIRIGLSPSTARRLPNYAFVVGAVSGIFRRGRAGFQELLRVGGVWVFGWVFGIAVGGVLIFFGASDAVADWFPPIFLGIAVVLTAFRVHERLRDMLDILSPGLAPKGDKKQVP